MKNLYIKSSLFLIPLFIIFLAFTGGPQEGYTGSPLDGNDCTSCHTPGPATIVEDWISTSIPAQGYSPGETYTITLTAFDQSSEKMGFQITAETETAKTGTWVITDATRTKLVGSSATHTSAGTAPIGSPNTWTIDWTAPASGTGTVTFYATVNNTNNNGSNQGDEIFRTWRSEPESNIGIAEAETGTMWKIYPNPTQDFIIIEPPFDANVFVYDNIGRVVSSFLISEDSYKLDVSDFDKGVYFIHLQMERKTTTKSFIKR